MNISTKFKTTFYTHYVERYTSQRLILKRFSILTAFRKTCNVCDDFLRYHINLWISKYWGNQGITNITLSKIQGNANMKYIKQFSVLIQTFHLSITYFYVYGMDTTHTALIVLYIPTHPHPYVFPIYSLYTTKELSMEGCLRTP